MNNKASKEILRLQKIAGIIKESWDDDEQEDKFDDYGAKKNKQSSFDPFGNQDYLDYSDDDFEKALKGGGAEKKGIEKPKDSKKKKPEDDIVGGGRSSDDEKEKKKGDSEELVSDTDLDDFLSGTGFDFKLSKKEMEMLNSGDKSEKGEFSIGGSDGRMGFSGNLDDYISNFLPSIKKVKKLDKDYSKEKDIEARKDREERNVRISRRTGEEKSTSRGRGIRNTGKRKKDDMKNELSLYEIYLNEVGVDFLDLKIGDDVSLKSEDGWFEIIDLEGPSGDDTGENPYIIVKSRKGEELEIPVSDIVEIADEPDSGEGEHYGDEEDDNSYYQSRGWKSNMEETQDPQDKMNKLVGLGEGKSSDFEKFMKIMMGLYDLSKSGFITPEEWKQIFPVYTSIYSRAKDMDVSNFKNDK